MLIEHRLGLMLPIFLICERCHIGGWSSTLSQSPMRPCEICGDLVARLHTCNYPLDHVPFLTAHQRAYCVARGAERTYATPLYA